MGEDWKHCRAVGEIDWARWEPVEKATLLFVIRETQVLLIHKKRGLGAGKINGPGGRIEPGETAQECAVREVQEEIGVTAHDVAYAGQLNFQFVDGFSIRGEVFRAVGYTGELIETDEATPEWFAIDALPFERMWADDAIWMPYLFARRRFRGRFIFDDDTMLDHEVVEV